MPNEVTCRRCHRPIDAEAAEMVRQTCEKRGMPQGTPTHCSECLWQSIDRRGDNEE